MTERAGFTFIELIVAMVLGGIIVTVLFQLISGQGRYVELQSAREEVQQNSRAALDLIGSELRSLPGGEALVQASDDEITIRTVRVWGVVCDKPGSNTLDIAIPTISGTSYTTNSGTGVVAKLDLPTGPGWTQAVGVSAIGGAAGSCAGAPLAAGSERRSLTVAALPQNNAGDEVQVGNTIYLYDQVTYQTGTSSSVPGLWIQRRIGTAAGQPFAGPINEHGGGLGFQYFADGASTPLSTPIVDADERASVTRVSVMVEAISRNRFGNTRESKADTIVVSLRNRLWGG